MIAAHPLPLPESVKALRIDAGAGEIDKLALTGGYDSFGEFCWDLVRWGRASDGGAFNRLGRAKAAAVKAASGLGIRFDDLADFFVPVEFSSSIYARMVDEHDLLSRVRRQTIRGNSLRMVAEDDGKRDDEVSRFSGIALGWLDEGDPYPEAPPIAGRTINFNLHKLGAMVPISNELIEDSQGAWETQITSRATRAMAWEVSRTIFEGAGGGVPLGAFHASNPSLLTIAAEAGQAAGTLTMRNIRHMISSMPAGHLARSTFHVGTELLEPLWEMNDEPGSPVLSAPTGPSAYAALMHRPLIPLEFASAIGDANDITLVDWDAYQLVVKGQTRTDISMHAMYSTDSSAIRFNFRADGKPLWNKPMTPYKGSRLSSPFIALAARN